MKRIKILVLIFFVAVAVNLSAQTNDSQSEIEQITTVLMDYIEGTANGEADRLKKAFHPELNLYSVDSDSLGTLSGKKYISYFENGKKCNRR